MTQTLPEELVTIDPFLRPIIHMAPFEGKLHPAEPASVTDEQGLLRNLSAALTGREMPSMLTVNCREAINRALAATVRSRDDVVAVIAPSGCGYVSACVTTEIEKFCTWRYGAVDNASIVFLIHEFGRFAVLPDIYRGRAIPVIEDCAYAAVDRAFSPIYGQQGDYVVYSMSKAFPVQFGGVLLSRAVPEQSHAPSSLSAQGRACLLAALAGHAPRLAEYNAARQRVYRDMAQTARACGLAEAWPASGSELAQSFLVSLGGDIDAAAMKSYLNAQGIESSVFYGGGAYFLPCHQSIGAAEIAYMFEHVRRALVQFKR